MAHGNGANLDKLIHELEYENQQYNKEIGKEQQIILYLEEANQKLQEDLNLELKRTPQLDEMIKMHHRQYTCNRDNVKSSKSTFEVLKSQEEALQSRVEEIHLTHEQERNDRDSVLKRYEKTWAEYKEVYEKFPLAKKLAASVKQKEEIEMRCNETKKEVDDLKEKIQLLEKQFKPYTELNEFVVKFAMLRMEAINLDKATDELEQRNVSVQEQLKQKQIKKKQEQKAQRKQEEEEKIRAAMLNKQREQEELRKREEIMKQQEQKRQQLEHLKQERIIAQQRASTHAMDRSCQMAIPTLTVPKRTMSQQNRISAPHQIRTPAPQQLRTSAPQPVQYGSSTPQPVQYGSSTPQPVQYGSSTPQPVQYGSSTPQPVQYGSSTPQPVQYGSSTPQPVQYGSSTPQPVQYGLSTPQLVKVPFLAPTTVPCLPPTPRPPMPNYRPPQLNYSTQRPNIANIPIPRYQRIAQPAVSHPLPQTPVIPATTVQNVSTPPALTLKSPSRTPSQSPAVSPASGANKSKTPERHEATPTVLSKTPPAQIASKLSPKTPPASTDSLDIKAHLHKLKLLAAQSPGFTYGPGQMMFEEQQALGDSDAPSFDERQSFQMLFAAENQPAQAQAATEINMNSSPIDFNFEAMPKAAEGCNSPMDFSFGAMPKTSDSAKSGSTIFSMFGDTHSESDNEDNEDSNNDQGFFTFNGSNVDDSLSPGFGSGFSLF